MIKSEFVLGDWKISCSMCGRDLLASEAVKNWQGMYRCPSHNEPRHPQDFVRGSKDIQTVPYSQPPSETFVDDFCTVLGMSGIPDYAIPDCSIPDQIPAWLP